MVHKDVGMAITFPEGSLNRAIEAVTAVSKPLTEGGPSAVTVTVSEYVRFGTATLTDEIGLPVTVGILSYLLRVQVVDIQGQEKRIFFHFLVYIYEECDILISNS